MSNIEGGRIDQQQEVGPKFISVESFAEERDLEVGPATYALASKGIPLLLNVELVEGIENEIIQDTNRVKKHLTSYKKYRWCREA